MFFVINEFLFVDLLLIHCLSLLFHDYIDLFPLNDVESMRIYNSSSERFISTLLKSIPAIIALILAVLYFGEWKTYIVKIFMFSYFTIGLMVIYWVWYRPYLFGTGEKQKLKYMNNYGRTHQILPAIGDNPRPNTLHIILHILFAINFLLMLMSGYNPISPF